MDQEEDTTIIETTLIFIFKIIHMYIQKDYIKEFEEKKSELQAKVIEIYEASADEIKIVVKEKKEGALKKVFTGVEKFLEELSKIEFP
uniref:Uncharacterized protein n=1 Tax=Lactuca sativa TaxID=4236 RepID=A0A9R1WTT5_LACSA|nr:hypothetical protein LSAT_V11C900458660 [Lactuca sativa]